MFPFMRREIEEFQFLIGRVKIVKWDEPDKSKVIVSIPYR